MSVSIHYLFCGDAIEAKHGDDVTARQEPRKSVRAGDSSRELNG